MLVTFISAKIGAMWSGLLTSSVILAVMGSIAHASDKKYRRIRCLTAALLAR
ncbi:hypothetical protein P4S68_11645 [Pseudoalteromonas sp. Hal099]